MADTLDKVNASFEDCEEMDDDIDMETVVSEQDKAEPMIDMDAVMGVEDAGEVNRGDTAKADEADKTVKKTVDDAKDVDVIENADAGKAKVVSIGQYRAG